MPRKPRSQSPTGVYHFINRGVNRKDIFHKKEDYEHYLGLISEYLEKLDLQLFHYSLMTNHTHLLIRSDNPENLSRFGHFIQRRYAYYYCKTHQWPEQLFRRRFLSIPVLTDSQLLECGRYIERNPLEAKVTPSLEDYLYTSYHYYAWNRPDILVTQNPLYEGMGKTPHERQAAYRYYVTHERIVRTPVSKKGILKELTCPF